MVARDRADGGLGHDGVTERVRRADQDAIGSDRRRHRVHCLK
jgi:hypothetical protein